MSSFIQNHQQKSSLPSPPNSSCGDEKEPEYSTREQFLLPPENYTIDHSSCTTTTTAAATTTSNRRRSSMSSMSSNNTIFTNNSSRKNSRRRRRVSSSSPYHKCLECGKVYKHPNCLSKHQWEHSEEWEYTSKFLLTKHQQVQLLEAAAILMKMMGKNHPFLKHDSSSSDIEIDLDDDLL